MDFPGPLDPWAWMHLMDTNVNGVFYAMKYEVAQMLKLNITGSIVNCGSIRTVTVAAYGAAYAASKHALSGLMKTFALAYAHKGVRVNNLNPSFALTEMTEAIWVA